jgi:hypothetical protein
MSLMISFVDENVGWVGASGGGIAYTTNGGNTWQYTVIAGPSTYFYSFKALDDSTAWVVGTEGAIMKYSCQTPSDIANVDPIPQRFALAQNYPNPFNATTTIEFSLEKAGEVTLSIYDILGRQVKTLYNGTLTAGSHSLIWNGTNESGKTVTSGVYFYRLENSEGSITKRMVMLK